MKRKLSKILILTLLLTSVFQKTIHADVFTTVVTIENQGGRQGQTIVTPLRLEGGAQIGGFEIDVRYDPEVLEFVGFEKGDLVAVGLFDYFHEVANHNIRIIFVTADTIRSDGLIGNLLFLLKIDATNYLPVGIPEAGVICDDYSDEDLLSAGISGVDETFQNTLNAQEITVIDDGQGVQGGSGALEGSGIADGAGASQTDDSPLEGNQEAENLDEERTESDSAEEEPELLARGEDFEEEEAGEDIESMPISEELEQEEILSKNRVPIFIGVILIGGILVGGIILWKKKQREKKMKIIVEPEHRDTKEESEE